MVDGSGAVDSEIAELKRRAGASTDAELALFLGVQRSAIAQWKKRGRVPSKARYEVDRIKADSDANRLSRKNFSELRPSLQRVAKALALRYLIDTTEPEDRTADGLILRAMYMDEIEMAAARILEDEMLANQVDAVRGFQRLFADTNFESRIGRKLTEMRRE